MSKDDARAEFVMVLDGLCSLFKPYVEAHKREKEEQERKRLVFNAFFRNVKTK